MLRLRGRVIQLSAAGDYRQLTPALTTVTSLQRRYASADNVDYKPIKKLLVANRGESTSLQYGTAPPDRRRRTTTALA